MSPLRAGALALALLVAGAARGADGDVVARVGDTEVTAAELKGFVAGLPAQDQAALQRDPAALARLVRTYLTRRLIVKTAQTKGWDRRPEVKAQLDRVREEALTELYLQNVSQPPEGYPGETDLAAAYEARKASFDAPAEYRIAQVWIAARKGDPEAEREGRAKIEATRRRLEAKGADFAAVAREVSEERASAEQGGEVGWLTEAQLVPAVRPVVIALAKGAVSEPVRTDEGWHLVKLLDARPAGRRPLAEVRGPLAQQLRAERAQANRRVYLEQLLGQSPPVINELALPGILPKAAPGK